MGSKARKTLRSLVNVAAGPTETAQDGRTRPAPMVERVLENGRKRAENASREPDQKTRPRETPSNGRTPRAAGLDTPGKPSRRRGLEGTALVLDSEVLGERVLVTYPGAVVENPDGLVVYSAEEVRRLRRLPPDLWRAVHRVKRVFGGEAVTVGTGARG